MARGETFLFNDFLKDLGAEVHTLASDVLKVALIDSVVTPDVTDTDPEWADYSTNEVSGTNYTAGGATIGTVTWTQTAGVTTLAGDDVGWTIHATGPTDARWGIIVNTSATNSECIGFVDLGGVVSLQADDIDIEWDGGNVVKLTANPAA